MIVTPIRIDSETPAIRFPESERFNLWVLDGLDRKIGVVEVNGPSSKMRACITVKPGSGVAHFDLSRYFPEANSGYWSRQAYILTGAIRKSYPDAIFSAGNLWNRDDLRTRALSVRDSINSLLDAFADQDYLTVASISLDVRHAAAVLTRAAAFMVEACEQIRDARGQGEGENG